MGTDQVVGLRTLDDIFRYERRSHPCERSPEMGIPRAKVLLLVG